MENFWSYQNRKMPFISFFSVFSCLVVSTYHKLVSWDHHAKFALRIERYVKPPATFKVGPKIDSSWIHFWVSNPPGFWAFVSIPGGTVVDGSQCSPACAWCTQIDWFPPRKRIHQSTYHRQSAHISYMCIKIYIYIYRERERERDIDR